MPSFCSHCGIALAENAQHSCASDASIFPGNGATPTPPPPANPTFAATNLSSNVAGSLAYAAGPFTGIAFLFLEPYRRDRYVRFHAWQSIFFSFAWIAFWIPWSVFTSTLLAGMTINNPGYYATNSSLPFLVLLITALNRLLWFAGFCFWAFLFYKGYTGQQFQIPVLGKFASSQAVQG